MTRHDFYAALGARIRQTRQRRHWSQLRLAVEIGVTPVAVCYWETAQRAPDLYTLRRLEQALGEPLL